MNMKAFLLQFNLQLAVHEFSQFQVELNIFSHFELGLHIRST